MESLTFWQKVIKAVTSSKTFAEIEAESKAWKVQCSNCKHECSIWEMGGIRWKAAGNPRVNRVCPNCLQLNWHTVYKKPV